MRRTWKWSIVVFAALAAAGCGGAHAHAHARAHPRRAWLAYYHAPCACPMAGALES